MKLTIFKVLLLVLVLQFLLLLFIVICANKEIELTTIQLEYLKNDYNTLMEQYLKCNTDIIKVNKIIRGDSLKTLFYY